MLKEKIEPSEHFYFYLKIHSYPFKHMDDQQTRYSNQRTSAAKVEGKEHLCIYKERKEDYTNYNVFGLLSLHKMCSYKDMN